MSVRLMVAVWFTVKLLWQEGKQAFLGVPRVQELTRVLVLNTES